MYALEGKPVFEYRGVSVYRRTQSWLYVLGDMAITERAGFRKDAAPEIIDALLDGETSSCDTVTAHIRAHGNKGLSHGEYLTEWQAGRMA